MLLIFGLLVSLLSFFAFAFGVGGGALLEEIDSSLGGMGEAIAAVILVLAAAFLVVGILHVVAAVGVFVHKFWARWLGIVLASIGLMLGVLLVIGAAGDPTLGSGDLLIFLVWLIAYGYILAALVAGGEHFALRYPTYR